MMFFSMKALALPTIAINFLLTGGMAFPSLAGANINEGTQSHILYGTIAQRQSKIPLRIMPLGASIMSGVGSSDGNGLVIP